MYSDLFKPKKFIGVMFALLLLFPFSNAFFSDENNYYLITQKFNNSIYDNITLNGTTIFDWSAVNQSGGGSSFVYSDYFNQNLNTTDNVRFNRIGIGTVPSYPIHYVGNLAGSSVGFFTINATSGISSALSFNLDVPSSVSATGIIGALGFYNKINEKKDRSGSTLIEGIRNEIGTNSVAQSGGTTDIKVINNDINFRQNTGGTQNAYGSYTDFAGPLILSGSPTYNLYGHYVVGNPTLDIASGTVNRYGVYATGFSKGTYDDVAFGFWTDGAIKGADYYSGDGTQGMTGTCTLASITTITVKDGLITGCS